MNKEYGIEFEVAGHFAHFNRPDCGDAYTSYPAPTYAAIRGMCEAIYRIPCVLPVPVQTLICKPVQYYWIKTNYNGPNRKPESIKLGNARQMRMLCLYDVCYKIYVRFEWKKGVEKFNNNALHQYQDVLKRKLRQGAFTSIPFLGLKEFVPNYFGPLRDTTYVDKTVNFYLPTMMRDQFFDTEDSGNNGVERAYTSEAMRDGRIFMKDVYINNGVLQYA